MRKLYSTIPMNFLPRPLTCRQLRIPNDDYDDGTDEELGNDRRPQRTPRRRPVDIYDNERDVWRM